MLHAKVKFLGLLCMAMAQAGCGGGGGSSSGSTPPPVVVVPPPVVKNASPGGMWQGTDSTTGSMVSAFVTETGKFEFLWADSSQYVGTGVTTGNSISGNLDGYALFGNTYPDGSIHGTGKLTGTVSERKTLNVTITFNTDSGNSTTNVIPMTFNTLYNQPSSPAAVAGNYNNSALGTVISISASGVLFSQDPTRGCVINGTIAAIDPTYNAYLITYGYANCTGTYAVLNGTTATGMAAIDINSPPIQLEFGVTGATTGSGTAGFVESWDHI